MERYGPRAIDFSAKPSGAQQETEHDENNHNGDRRVHASTLDQVEVLATFSVSDPDSQ